MPPIRTLVLGGSFYFVFGAVCVWMDEQAFAAGFPNEPLYWLHLVLFAAQSLLGFLIVLFLVLFAATKALVEICKVVKWFRCHDPRTVREFSEQTRIGQTGLLFIAVPVAGSIPMLWPLARILFWS